MSEHGKRIYQDPPPSGDYRFFQIAWVVDDLFAAMDKWTRVYGVGPFHVMPRRPQSLLYRGDLCEIDMQLAVVQSGPLLLEFIRQFGGDPSPYREIYPQGRGGVHHLCTVIEAYDETKAHYEGLGYDAIAEVQGGMRIAHFDTFEDFGFITEVVERTDAFMANLARIAQTCATWDGSDPIRLLTREGYRTP